MKGPTGVDFDRPGSHGDRHRSPRHHRPASGVRFRLSARRGDGTRPGVVLVLIPAVLCCLILVVRTVLEDRTLQAELPGYRECAKAGPVQAGPWRLVKGSQGKRSTLNPPASNGHINRTPLPTCRSAQSALYPVKRVNLPPQRESVAFNSVVSPPRLSPMGGPTFAGTSAGGGLVKCSTEDRADSGPRFVC